MTINNTSILRSIIILGYVAIIVLVLYGIASVFVYLNTGADRGKMLHTVTQQNSPYKPNFVWIANPHKGRATNSSLLKTIKKDYLNAWYIRQICYKTNTTTGVNDYYTKQARQNIINTVAYNKKNNITYNATTLNHNPKVEFFSEDGKLIVLTDTNVQEYKRIYNNNQLVDTVNETANYKVTLLLEDGLWRIRHLVKTKSTTPKVTIPNQPLSLNVKGINYYPQASPWRLFTDSFNAKTIKKDFKIIKSVGLNSIRIFVPYESFGAANVSSKKIEQLITILDIAQKQKLKVMVTLFDFYGSYEVLTWTQTYQHAKTIVNALKHHEALLGWDVKNEPNLDFETRGKDLVTAWLEKMIVCIKTYDKTHPVTIGWSNIENATVLHGLLDVVTFHYYEDLDTLSKKHNTLKTAVGDKPIILTEYGQSSYIGFWNPFGNSEAKQAEYHKTIQGIFKQSNMMYMSWTLYDFTTIPTEVVGPLPWRKNTQKYYGFINENGEKKPAYKYISGVN